MPGLLASLLPDGVSCAETVDDLAEELHPAERAYVATASDKRVREFTTVRACARRALESLGEGRPVQVPGEHGAPAWPDGIVGAMTHCDGYRAAAVARTTDVLGLGIDAEPHLPLPARIRERVLRSEEREQTARLAAEQPGVEWGRLVFCAKEAVYKLWSPLTGRWLGFDDASVALSPDGTFTARLVDVGDLPAALPTGVLSGRWACADSLLVAAAVLPADAG